MAETDDDETGPEELIRLCTDGSAGSLFLSTAVNSVTGLANADDIERLGALADVIEAVGRQISEEKKNG